MRRAGWLALDSSRGQHVSALGPARPDCCTSCVHARNGRVAAAAVDASSWAMQGTAAIRHPPAAGLKVVVVDYTFDSKRGICVCARRWCAGLSPVQCAALQDPVLGRHDQGGPTPRGKAQSGSLPALRAASSRDRDPGPAIGWFGLFAPAAALPFPVQRCLFRGRRVGARDRQGCLSLGYTTCVCVCVCVHHTVVMVCLQSAFPFHLNYLNRTAATA
ncbi:hypothetical protein COCVIDRAFT_21116 [Bipolaris victoriae FI3]|uniref:Uncharacterized protein n=1 Tax=Bipolaris victoriae (strain FI3) TaxID=930091 RepID=W7E4B8_BIPV3|nr:hypothetical protein COCVIDRAFT_21116 [Bipolaris victoriae FI3]